MRPVTLLKEETLTQVFPSGFCRIFKSTYFYRISLVATSVLLIVG